MPALSTSRSAQNTASQETSVTGTEARNETVRYLIVLTTPCITSVDISSSDTLCHKLLGYPIHRLHYPDIGSIAFTTRIAYPSPSLHEYEIHHLLRTLATTNCAVYCFLQLSGQVPDCFDKSQTKSELITKWSDLEPQKFPIASYRSVVTPLNDNPNVLSAWNRWRMIRKHIIT